MLEQPTRSTTSNKILLPGRGNKKAKIFIVGSHPNVKDLQAYEVFHQSKDNATANELFTALELAQIPSDCVWFSTICKSGIGNKPKPKAEDINEGFEYLEEELSTIKPDLIIALGAEAFKRIMKKNVKIGDNLGEIIDCPYNCKVLANHSPGTVVAVDPIKRNEFREIFDLAKRFVTNTLIYTPFNWHVINDKNIAKDIIAYYIDREMFDVGYDLEWRGKKWSDDEVVFSFQFSAEDNEAFVFDLTNDGIHENIELLKEAKPLLEHPRVRRMGWNIRADDKRLTKRGFVLSDETLKWDGMKAMYAFDSRWGKGLEVGIRKFSNIEPYYNELNLFLRENKIDKSDMSLTRLKNPELFFKYCGGDAVAHRTVCLNQIKQFPSHLLPYFENVYMPMTNYFLEMEMHGIPLDLDVMKDITDKYQHKKLELATTLNQKLAVLGINDFNINSPPQKKKLLFETLQLQPVYYTKAGKSPKPRSWYERQKPQTKGLYSPSTNGKSLSTLVFELQQQAKVAPGELGEILTRNLGIVKNMLDLNRISVFSNKFLSQKGVTLEDIEDLYEDDELDELEDLSGEEPLKQSYWVARCNDNTVKADFYECLKNFRSSSRPNIQNPASKVLPHINRIFCPNYDEVSKEEKKILEQTIIPKNIRNIFWSGSKDKCYVCADIAGADLAIQAFLSQDPDFIADIRSGSFHAIKMRDYFQNPALTKDDVAEYTMSKSITFRCSYTAELNAAAEAIQSEIFAESGLYVPLERIEYALGTWSRYTKYIGYREACKQEVIEHNKITNARGMVLYFEDTDNFAIKAGYLNESLAYPIAGELALYAYNVCVNLRKQLKKDGLWLKYVSPINLVHDDIQFIIDKGMLKDNYFPEVLKYYMCEYTKIASGDTLGAEVTISDRWKGKEKLFSNETKWDYSQNKWIWKD
jgi:uracil-DNA glycosylase family 4